MGLLLPEIFTPGDGPEGNLEFVGGANNLANLVHGLGADCRAWGMWPT